MTIGAWKSYYELEDNLSLQELVELYASIIEQENEQFKRDASLQGIDLDKNSSKEQDNGMEERFREHIARKKGKGAVIKQPEESIPGTGYMQI